MFENRVYKDYIFFFSKCVFLTVTEKFITFEELVIITGKACMSVYRMVCVFSTYRFWFMFLNSILYKIPVQYLIIQDMKSYCFRIFENNSRQANLQIEGQTKNENNYVQYCI